MAAAEVTTAPQAQLGVRTVGIELVVPDGMNWFAQDPDGTWWFYSHKPETDIQEFEEGDEDASCWRLLDDDDAQDRAADLYDASGRCVRSSNGPPNPDHWQDTLQAV